MDKPIRMMTMFGSTPVEVGHPMFDSAIFSGRRLFGDLGCYLSEDEEGFAELRATWDTWASFLIAGGVPSDIARDMMSGTDPRRGQAIAQRILETRSWEDHTPEPTEKAS